MESVVTGVTMTDNSNVVQFPRIKKETPLQSEADLRQRVEDYKLGISNDISAILMTNIMNELSFLGCEFDEDSFEHHSSIVLVAESIKSLYLQTNGIDYYLQDIASEVYQNMDFDDHEEDE